MRKTIGLILIGMLLFGVSNKVLALTNYDSDIGYVIVRCTVTVDVDVLDGQATAWFVQISTMGALSPNQEDISISSISVQNKSSGAILKYAVLVSSIQRTENGSTWISDDDNLDRLIKGWYLCSDGNNDSPGEFVLKAVFAKSRPSISDFTTGESTFTVNLGGGTPTDPQLQTYTYKTGGDTFDPDTNSSLRYPSALGNTTGTNAVSPTSTDNPRGLWFYIKTPQAVTDEFPRRIVIVVYGGLGSSW